jgi:hypothetical protein
MAEWSKAAVLKTVSRQRDVGSNPTPSAIKLLRDFIHFLATAVAAAKLESFVKKYFKPNGWRLYGEMAE